VFFPEVLFREKALAAFWWLLLPTPPQHKNHPPPGLVRFKVPFSRRCRPPHLFPARRSPLPSYGLFIPPPLLFRHASSHGDAFFGLYGRRDGATRCFLVPNLSVLSPTKSFPLGCSPRLVAVFSGDPGPFVSRPTHCTNVFLCTARSPFPTSRSGLGFSAFSTPVHCCHSPLFRRPSRPRTP